MFWRTISTFIFIFVAVVSATNYRQPEYITGYEPDAAAHRSRRDNSGLSAVGPGLEAEAATAAEDVGPLTATRAPSTGAATAMTTAVPCNDHTPNDTAISILRNLSAEERNRRLIEAAKEGEVSELQLLLAAGADVQARDEDEFTAVLWAADKGHVEAARCLIRHGADLGARNMEEDTPLHLAAWNGHAVVVRLLAAASADVNARSERGRTPLHWAAFRGHAGAAAALLQAGADRGAADDGGQTPLDVARSSGHQPLIDVLEGRQQASPE